MRALLPLMACVVTLCGCPGTDAPDSSAVAPAAGGLRAVVDPATGELTSDPAVEPEPAAFRFREDPLSTSDVGLYEEELDDGTVMLDPQGRFRSGLRVTISSDGPSESGVEE